MMSMTGFAALEAGEGAARRSWDIRSVNARGLDLRLRLHDAPDGLEKVVRSKLSAALARGNVTLSLKVAGAGGAASVPQLNEAALAAALSALAHTEAAALDQGVTLNTPSAADVLALRGVFEHGAPADEDGASLADLTADLDTLIASFLDMRRTEGEALRAILSDQVAQIESLTQAATALGPARSAHMEQVFEAAMAKVLGDDRLDADKVAQDVAALVVKADVTEEIDRLHAHVATARGLLSQDGPVGRKLDFLTQEFNREANTLCSKSQMAELTQIGLDLKVVIDQMREQVQNVE